MEYYTKEEMISDERKCNEAERNMSAYAKALKAMNEHRNCTRCGSLEHEDHLWIGDLCDSCHDEMH